jgi:isopentenyl phosphate kinase
VIDVGLAGAAAAGDRIMLSMAAALQPQYAVFLTDVPGLLTAPPDTPGAQLIPRVWVQAAEGAEVTYELPVLEPDSSSTGGQQQQQQQQGVTTSTAAHDTTGGIAAKVQAAADIVRVAAIPVVIAEAGSAPGAAAVLDGVALSHQDTAPACTVIAAAR